MARRGTPLPYSIRERLRERSQTEPIKRIAREEGVSRNTVRKYRDKSKTRMTP